MGCFTELRSIYLHYIVTALSALFCLPSLGLADIIEDFKPIDGYVVLAEDNNFIIDLDGEDGIAIGDIFSVIGPGKKLVHPISQKVIGNLEEVKGVVRVVKIDNGFSHVRPIGD